MAGRFTVDGLWPGKYKITVKSGNGTGIGLAQCRVTSNEAANVGTIVLKKMRAIRGTVFDEEGETIEGAKISLDIDSGSPWYGYSWRAASLFPLEKRSDEEKGLTDSAGRFKIMAMSDEDLDIRAEHEDYETGSISVPENEDEELKITLRRIEFSGVRVKVLDGATGNPVENAKVVVMQVLPRGPSEHGFYGDDYYSPGFSGGFGMGGFGSLYGGIDETEKSTDGEGIATFKIREAGKWTFMAATPGNVSDERKITVRSDQDQEIKLTLKPAPSVVIAVLSKETAEPVADATIDPTLGGRRDVGIGMRAIRAVSRNSTTGEDGTLKLTMVPAGKYDISINAFGYKTETRSITVSEGENIFTILLKKSAVVTGNVVDTDGKPIADARLELGKLDGRNRGFSNSTVSRKDGSFKLGISQSGRYKIEASHRLHSEFESKEFRIEGNEELTNFNIVMTDGGTISGRILDAEGRPVPDAEVRYFLQTEDEDSVSQYYHFYGDSEARIGDDGAYAIEHITPGTYRVAAYSKMHLKSIRKDVLVEEGVDTSGIDFMLQEGLKLTGVVTDKEGRPVQDAQIHLWRIWGEEEGKYDPFSTSGESKSASDGTFIAGGLADSEYQLSVGKHGYLDWRKEVRAGTTGHKIVLRRSATLTGRIVSASDGKAVTSFIINEYGSRDGEPMAPDIYGGYNSEESKSKGQDEGSFTIENLEPGKRNLKIFARGYAAKKIEGIEVKAEDVTDIGTITVDKGLSINVTVTSETHGMPIEGATVMVQVKPDDRGRAYRYNPYYDRDRGLEAEPRMTDSSGRCIIDGMTPGRKILNVAHESFVSKQINIDVSAFAGRNISIKLSKGLTLRGTVLSRATGQPVEGASVTLTPPRDYTTYLVSPGSRGRETTTDQTGVFTIESVKSAMYSLTIHHDDYTAFSEQITITPEKQSQTYHLARGGSLVVRVRDRDGQPVEGCDISFLIMHPGSTTDSNGESRFENLPAKAILVSADDSHRQQTKRVSIVAGETAELEFVLGGGYAVYGTVTRNEEPARDIFVSVISRGLGEYGPSNDSGRIHEGGEFRVEGIKPGSYHLKVYSYNSYNAGSRICARKDFEVIDRDLEVNIDISSGTISGTVTDENGNPVAEADIQIIAIAGSDTPFPSMSLDMNMSRAESLIYMGGGNRTNADGKYTFENVETGKYHIGASKRGFAPASRQVSKGKESDLENVDLVLQRSRKISGRITTEDGLSLRRANLLVLNASGNSVVGDLLILDDEGRYEYGDIGTGQCEIVVAARGYAFARKKVHMASEEHEIDFVLRRGNTLTITVTDGNGVPIEGAHPVLTHDDPLMADYLRYFHTYGGESGMEPSRSADGDGKITIDALSKQKYDINVTASGYAAKKVTVHMTGQDKNVDVLLRNED
jgi:protocatechuate 3,4-dioxygenase beta subunit